VAVLVDLQGVGARSAERPLFEGLSLTVATGDRLGVVGINGTGKSTLLAVLSGASPPAAGNVRRGRGTQVAYLPQEPALPAGTVGAAVGHGWEAQAALDRLGMAAHVERDVATLSGGQRKRVALAAVLAHPADLLVLDEPTNHLDLGAVAWLESRLSAFRGGLVLVSHDRHLLDRVTTRMLELDRGRSYLHDGGYASYLEARAERAARAEQTEASRRNLARSELAWLRRGAPARSRKPRARLVAATRVVAGRAEAPARRGDLELAFGAPRLGDQVLELEGVAYSYPGATDETLSGVDLTLSRQDRLAVVGPNGSGKTTLLDLLAGRRTPSAGSLSTGPTVEVGYYDQLGVDLDGTSRVRDLVAGPGRPPGSPEDQALMERFWFGGELAFAPVRTLSGGERRRLQLLVVLAARPNVLLLDEPTNDLDLDTLRALEDFLEGWPGALVVVSHDRTFLERTAETVVAVDDAGGVEPVPGGVDGWIRSATDPAATRTRAPSATADRSEPTRTAPTPTAPTPTAPPGSTPSLGRPGPPRNPAQGRRLRELDKEMARWQRRVELVTVEMSATTDHRELDRLGRDAAEAQARLEAVEEEWLALAERSGA